MDWPAGLSHAQFGEGARAWAEQADGGERAGEELGLHEGAKNWKWAEHEVSRERLRGRVALRC